MNNIASIAKKGILNVLSSGIERDFIVGERSRVIFLNSVTLAGGAMIAIFAFLNLAVGNIPLGAICAASAFLVFANFIFIRLTKRFTAGGIIDCALIFIFYLILAYTGGEAGSGVLWSMTYPLIALFLLGPVWGSAIVLVYGAAISVLLFLPALNLARFPPLYSARVVGTYIFILVFALIYELVRRAALSRLYKANDSLSRVSGQLVEKKKETDDILSSVLEGIFLLDKDHKLGEAHSKKFEELLERECVVGEDFTALLSPALGERDCTAVEDYLELLLAGTVNEELLAEINPLAEASLEFARPDGSPAAKRLRFQFIKVASGEATYPIMGVIEDATGEFELKRLMEESEIEHKRSMESLFQIIHVDPAMMSEFIADSEAELEGINDLMREERLSGKPLLEALYQSMHAVKGNAALLGLEEFSKKIHAHEDKIKQKLEQGYEWRDILELTIGLGDIKRELDAIKALIEKVLRFQVASTKAGVKEGNLLAYSIEKIVKRESARTGVPAAANIEGMVSSKIPDVYRKLVKDAIAQFVRNSFAHGFESLETRVARGKEAEGRIILSIERGAKTISIRYADDGAGLDPEILRLRARAMPEFSECADAMTPIDLAKLIFLPGFSTAADTSLSAGRGVGLALVKNRVNEAGGKILVRSARGRSLEFSIMLPLAESKHAEAVS